MFKEQSRMLKSGRPATEPLVVFVVGLLLSIGLGSNPALAAHSEHHVITIDKQSKKAVGEKTWKEILQFFDDAETAIESKNLEMLMNLYSDNYKNGPHTKESVKDIWVRIFKQMGDLATIHNMRFVSHNQGSDMVIIRCSGLLLGVPASRGTRLTIDNWVENDHILVREKGKWKLIGISGKTKERFWFDSPMHPLF